ncbi:MAG TPA: tetratricopeptide repeat protein [Sphingomicrobium sp.]
MRSKSRLLVVALVASALAAPVVGQKRDDDIAPKSVDLLRQGQELYSAGKFNEATDALETALAVDPRNRMAFVSLARVATAQKLFGKAIRLTNKALLLDPNDPNAISVQGQAMVQLGAVARAQANVQKLKAICPQGCAQLAELSAAVSKGPAIAAAKPATKTKAD